MKRNQYPSKEEMIEYYIKGLHTVSECSKRFGIGKNKVYSCLRAYGLERTAEDKSRVYSKAQSDEANKTKTRQTNVERYGAANKKQADAIVRFVDGDRFLVRGKEFSVGWLKSRYLDDNMSADDLSGAMGIGKWTLSKICAHYGVKKDSKQRYGIILERTKSKYGVASTFQLDSVKEKARNTCVERYGVPNCMQSAEIRERASKTNLSRYGVSNYMSADECKAKVKATNLSRYGCFSHMQKNMLHIDVWNDRDSLIALLKSTQKKMTAYDIMVYFNMRDRTSIYQKISDWGLSEYVDLNPPRSRYEDDIIGFLKELGVENLSLNDRTILDGQEIDIYMPTYKIGIEFNGDYWHSDIFYSDHSGRSTHHQDKSLLAEEKGVFLFHIFEHEWNDPMERDNIKNRLKSILQMNAVKIPARKCRLVKLTKQEKKDFLKANHIQGNDHSSEQYGLTYNGELVSCMTFVHPKNGKYTWELTRFCNKHGCVVQGGASKLFKHFIEGLNVGNTVSSYNDITKTKGDLYKTLGFECVSVNQPNYIWMNFQTKDIRTRYQEQAGGEAERMHNQDYHRICDCGTKTWVYTKAAE